MRLLGVGVHNFRGIHDAEFQVHGYSLLVGANNAGKSTVIDAIRAFYEKGGFKFDKGRDMPLKEAADAESWIELEFQLTADEHESIADEYKRTDRRLRVRKRFATKEKLENKTSAEGYVFAYTSAGTLHSDSFYGAKNVQSGKFGDIVFVPAVSKVDDHTKLTGPSALRDLLTGVLEDVVEDSESFAAFNTHFAEFAGKIKEEQTDDGRSLVGLETELNQALKPWGADFRLRLNAPKTADIIKSMLGHEFLDRDHGKPQAIDQYGSGFQRQFIFALIDIASRYVRKRPPKKSKEFSPSLTLILFEEPEAFLHPPQQEILARGLMKLAEVSDRQVLCSTHSSHFVSKNADHLPSLIRLARVAGVVSCYQVTAEAWATLANENQAINEIAGRWPKMRKDLSDDDFKCEMEAVKHCLWLNPDRCGLFFANHVLLVEGPTEVALINRLIADGRLRAPPRGLYVLDGLGKYNMPRFLNLLRLLGIPNSVLHDDDLGKEEHGEINALIRRSCDEKLTTKYQVLPGSIEAVLGIPATKPHRKPQHTLFHYAANRIDGERLKAFCDLVDACLPRDDDQPFPGATRPLPSTQVEASACQAVDRK